MAKDDEILALLRDLKERVVKAEQRAESAEQRLKAAGLTPAMTVPPPPEKKPGKYRYYREHQGEYVWVFYDSPRFRITAPRYCANALQVHPDPTRRRLQFVEASPENPAVITVPEDTRLDRGLQPEQEVYVPPAPHFGMPEQSGRRAGTAAEVFGVPEDPAPSGRAADRAV